MEQPVTVTEKERRFPGAIRVLLGIVLAIGSWVVVLGAGWLVFRYVFG